MSDEVSLSKGWSLDAYVAHNESMRDEIDKRYEQRFRAQEEAVKAAMASADKATQKAETASDKRFEGVNEFRATLADQAATLIGRSEVEQTFKSLNEKVDIIMGRQDRLEGRAGGFNATWGYLVGAVVVLGGILTIITAIVGAAIYISTKGS